MLNRKLLENRFEDSLNNSLDYLKQDLLTAKSKSGGKKEYLN